MVEVKALMALAEDNDVVSKEGAKNGEYVKISMRKTLFDVINQLTEDPSNSGQKDIVFVKSLADDTKVSILGVERPWLSEAKGFIFPNNDTGRILPAESQRDTTDPPVAVTDSSAIDYDSANESLVCSTLIPPLEKLDGVELVSGPKTIKLILKSKSTFKAEALKGAIINEPSSTSVKGNKSTSALKVNSTLAGKLKNMKIKDDPHLAIVMKELNNLKLQIIKNQSSYSRNKQPQQVPQNALRNKYKTQFKKGCELCGLNNHLFENCYKVLYCKKCERTDHKTCDHAEHMSTMNMTRHLKGQVGSSSRSRTPRPSKHFFSPCIHYGFSDHLSDDWVNYPICDICGSYDHDTYGHNRIISLRRGIKPRNHQHVMQSCKTCGSTVHTTTGHNDIEWFRRGEALQAKKAEALKTNKTKTSNANRSKAPTKRKPIWYLDSGCSRHMTGVKSYLHKYVEQPGPKNSILINFYDEKGISQKFSSPYTPEQNGVAKRKNRTLIEAARTMLLGSVFPKQYWTEAVATACYTQNRSTIVKRHHKNPYEIFHKRILNINFLHVFGCPIFNHNHKDHLGKFNEIANDALVWVLEEIHVTWAQLEKKRIRTRLYTNYLEENHTECGDGVANYK
ncbi:retrovirus-related pol polyprotein from transposon TNT 1-94 [Tanacetum coccineum]